MRIKRRKLKRKMPALICLLLLLLVLAGCGVYLKAQELFNDITPSSIVENVDMFLPKPERMNVLLLGIDARAGETMARTDTIILASVDQKTKQVAFLSIPRDTRVSIPGYGKDKINSASAYGGPELTAQTVSQLLDTTVKDYVLVNFSGFKNIVDALGGVTIDVEQDMYHWDNEDNYAYQIDLEKGLQRLDGDKALQYVRYRDYPMGDIDRAAHQQKFLVALGKEILQPSTITKLPNLVPEINRYVKTNLGMADLLKLASASKNLENGNFVAQTLPGRVLDVDGGSYWGVEPEEAKLTLAKLFRGETETNVVLTSPMYSQSYRSSETYVAPQKTTEENIQKPITQTPLGQNGIAKPASKTDKEDIAGDAVGGNNDPDNMIITTPGETSNTSESEAGGQKSDSNTATKTNESKETDDISGNNTTYLDEDESGEDSDAEPEISDEPIVNPGIPGRINTGGV